MRMLGLDVNPALAPGGAVAAPGWGPSRVTALPVQENAGVDQAAAEAVENQRVAAAYLVGSESGSECQWYGRGRCVAVAFNTRQRAIDGDAGAFADRFRDADVGAVRDEPVDVLAGEAGVLHQPCHAGRDGFDSPAIDLAAVLPDEAWCELGAAGGAAGARDAARQAGPVQMRAALAI